MSEITNLKKISAPTLSTEYGVNIKKTFENIDSNFGALNNSELVKGETGTGLISAYIPFNILLKSDPYTVDDYQIESQLPGIEEALNEISREDTQSVINQLKGYNGGMLLFYDTPTEEQINEHEIIHIKTSTSFTFYDDRFKSINNLESTVIDGRNLEDITDMTGTLCFVNNENGGEWKLVQNLPTLYYNRFVNKFCWIICGNKTDIVAQGPNGKDGKNGDLYITIAENFEAPTANNPQQCTLSQIWSNNGSSDPYSNGGFVHINGSLGIVSGTPCIVIPDNDNAGRFYLSTIIYSAGNNYALANVTVNNAIFNELNTFTVKDAMEGITTANTGSNGIHGYYIPVSPMSGTSKGGYVFFVDQDESIKKAHISLVSNYDDPVNTVINDSNNQIVINGQLSNGIGQINATGLGAHAEGYADDNGSIPGQINATGLGAHAEGYAAIGVETLASGTGSHAEGYATKATGSAAHAEGWLTNAFGGSSHAEGGYTTASGTYSHAEGFLTIASGDYSHAGGLDTVAMNKNMFVCGKHNPEYGYLRKIGDGTMWALDNTASGEAEYEIIFAIGDGEPTNKHYAFIVAQKLYGGTSGYPNESEIFIPYSYNSQYLNKYIKLVDINRRAY